MKLRKLCFPCPFALQSVTREEFLIAYFSIASDLQRRWIETAKCATKNAFYAPTTHREVICTDSSSGPALVVFNTYEQLCSGRLVIVLFWCKTLNFTVIIEPSNQTELLFFKYKRFKVIRFKGSIFSLKIFL